ncbi:MAG: type II toxin-antitoxin system RelE/ParE family toxin [Deltaproteobacteria bacterium]|nr:type II toxin-antitoxin system RelE/ParE family toxin [Deltaproteobacteria bacterium]
MRVRWLRTAKNNLEAAAEFIARDDLEAAQKFYSYIRERADHLANNPNMGRPGRVFGTRELVIGGYPYIIPYRLKDGEVQILRVFHTSQKPPLSWGAKENNPAG